MKKYWSHLFVTVVAMVLLILSISANLLLLKNTLSGNGQWTSTKTTLEKSVNGAFQFISNTQALARGRLNLGAWGGFQEIVYDRPAVFTRIEFEYILEPNAYLCILFVHANGLRSGIRISANNDFPDMTFTASEQGEFSNKRIIQREPEQPNIRRRMVIELHGDEARASIDGKPLVHMSGDFTHPVRPGFRNGLHSGIIINASFTDDTGKKFHESFLNFYFVDRFWPIIVLTVILANSLAIIAGIGLMKKETSHVFFGMFTVNSITAFIFLLCLAYQYFAAPGYPVDNKRLRAIEQQWKITTAKEIMSSIKEIYSATPKDDVKRIIFCGSSQTWGAGAAKEEETFVKIFEKSINGTPSTSHFECINAAVSGESSLEISNRIDELLNLKPYALILNLSNNDKPEKPFEDNLEKIIHRCLERNVILIFALEANSPEMDNGSLLVNHETMRRLASKYKLQVVDLHNGIKLHADEGFVWWDFVHPTSFGHRLLAGILLQAVKSRL